MKSILALCGLGLVWCFALPAAAEAPPVCRGKDLTEIAGLAEARAGRADDLVNADGLFWRIDKSGLAPSYLYGTIHSTDKSALALARHAAEQIGGVKVVATELGGPLDAIGQGERRRGHAFEGARPRARHVRGRRLRRSARKSRS